jgi:hypothetical protein
MYLAECHTCGTKHRYFSKIDNRNVVPCCCGTPTVRIIEAAQVQAQTVSGLIHCSDGTVHEGSVQFEKHMARNRLIPGSDVSSEAEYRAAETQKTVDKERRADIEKIATTLGD